MPSKKQNELESENNQDDEKLIQVDIDEAIAQGTYSNMVISNYSQEEFVLDFVFLQPQLPKGKIRSRIILSPKNAKRLAHLLKGNVQEYEKAFGIISDENKSKGIQLSIN